MNYYLKNMNIFHKKGLYIILFFVKIYEHFFILYMYTKNDQKKNNQK
jgi:phage-related protein